MIGLLAFAGLTARADTVTLIQTNAVWRYTDAGVDPGTTWRSPAFNDGAWPSGPAKLGFGEFDVVTPLNPFPPAT